MYKTIRHGENSLQYTILPQSDDFRIEGKLTSAEGQKSNCSSSSSSGSGSTRKLKSKRPKRRSFFTYLGLIFVCTVIVGAVLIPFFFTLPNPAEWFMDKHGKAIPSQLKGRGSYSFSGSGPYGSYVGNGINVGKTVKIINKSGVEKIILRVNKTSNVTNNEKNLLNNKSNLTTIAKAQENFTVGNAETRQSTDQATGTDDKQKEKAQNVNEDNSNSVNSNPPIEHFVTEVRFEPVDAAVPSTMPPGVVVPTIVVTTLRNQFSNKEFTEQLQVQDLEPQRQQERLQAIKPKPQAQIAPNVRPTTTFSTSTQNQSYIGNSASSQNSTLITRIIQVPLLKSASKKPIIPLVLVKTSSHLITANGINISKSLNTAPSTTSAPQLPGVPSVINDIDGDASGGPVIEPAQATDWIHGHWPFVDPSTYFQWTGYKAEDSVLLPALLGFALIGIVLIITVCLVARNKRTIVSSVRRRNRNVSDIEENGTEDNTTLLTTTNLSDED